MCVLPDSGAAQHGVLIAAEGQTVTPTGALATPIPPQTERIDPAGQLGQAGSRLGIISISGVKDRRKAARIRAALLGESENVGLTAPSYLYALVRAGYVDPPAPLR